MKVTGIKNKMMEMKRKLRIGFVLAGLFLLCCYEAVHLTNSKDCEEVKEKEALGKALESKGKYTVVIDAGHGGNDPGKVGSGNVLEKDINLEIALALQKYLSMQDISVVMTRNEDVHLSGEGAGSMKSRDMKERIRIANGANADLMISIHQNSFPQESVKGAQVFFYNKSEEGKKLAETLQEIIKEIDPENHRQCKSDTSYYLLKNSSIPTVIVECGFLSNKRELELLQSKEYTDRLAYLLSIGIWQYLNGRTMPVNTN